MCCLLKLNLQTFLTVKLNTPLKNNHGLLKKLKTKLYTINYGNQKLTMS